MQVSACSAATRRRHVGVVPPGGDADVGVRRRLELLEAERGELVCECAVVQPRQTGRIEQPTAAVSESLDRAAIAVECSRRALSPHEHDFDKRRRELLDSASRLRDGHEQADDRQRAGRVPEW
jgi:hypothetical protein